MQNPCYCTSHGLIILQRYYNLPFHSIVDRITTGQRINSHPCPACGVRSGISRGDFLPARQRSRGRRPKPSLAVPFDRASRSTRGRSAKRSPFKIHLKKPMSNFALQFRSIQMVPKVLHSLKKLLWLLKLSPVQCTLYIAEKPKVGRCEVW
jgi:hypothetical protein